MELTGPRYQQLQNALLKAFPNKNSLAQMVEFGLDENLDAISMGDNLTQIVFQLIGWSEARGQTAKLVAVARDMNPVNPALHAFAEQVGLAPIDPHHLDLERIIQETNSFLDVEKWRNRLGDIEPKVCRVEVDSNKGAIYGTGFLLGPDVVISNYHVLESVILGDKGSSTSNGESAKPADVVLRFDYKRLADGTTLNPGTVYHLRLVDWLIDSSETEPPGTTPAIDQLDYVLLWVDGTPGDDPVGNQNAAPKRGFLEPFTSYQFSPNTPLFIVQHPQGDPLQLALDTNAIIGVNAAGTRVTYRTNTLPGSSGSPCFNSDWELVALHHAGDPNFSRPTYNEGIPFAAIVALVERRNKLGVIGGKKL